MIKKNKNLICYKIRGKVKVYWREKWGIFVSTDHFLYLLNDKLFLQIWGYFDPFSQITLSFNNQFLDIKSKI